jgi:hypothetical protein
MTEKMTKVLLVWNDGSGELVALFSYEADARSFIERYKWEDRFSGEPDEFGPLLIAITPENETFGKRLGR